MMADFVTPRHSAVMERLRRRIEHFRQHHNSCESRYDTATLERLEHERQQTFNLHQRCLQAKAKRSNKHRQPQSSAGEQREQQAAQRDQGAGQRVQGGAGGEHQAAGESGGSAAEQSRNSTLIALQETVKRKLESAGSPGNGFSDSFPPNKKACLENTGSPLDSKLGLSDVLNANGNHGNNNNNTDPRDPADFHRKEMKQEPDDMLPIMPPSGNNNSLFPDLNLNEQEWTELMEELNCSVAYEDIQDILNDGFEDRKDPLEIGGGASLLPPDLVNVKTEFSPSSVAFEQDSRTVSPHLRPSSSSSGPPPPPHSTNSPIASSSSTSSSPSVAPPPPLPRQHHLAPPPKICPRRSSFSSSRRSSNAPSFTDKYSTNSLKRGPNSTTRGPMSTRSSGPRWPPPSQSPLGGAFGLDKPSSPSLYQQDFNPGAQKQLLMPNKGPQKAGYMSGPQNMMGHQVSGSPLGHPAPPGAQVTAAMLNYSNTKPLSHFEAAPGPPRPQNTQSQNKAALLTLLRQQQQSKQKNMNFRHIPHTQDQNSYAAPPPAPGNNPAMSSSSSGVPPGNHGNTGAYLSSQVALKQQQHQQILEQQKQQYLQRQLLMAEQEKQRQQDQQLQRHLTRPPPQYQDQPGPPTNQNAFPQPPGNQFTASSQPMGSVGSMGGPAPSQRMFPQNQGILGMSLGGGPSGGVAPPPTGSDISLTSCGGDVLYNNSMQQPVAMTRQPLSAMATATYRHSLLAQQHLKGPPNASMLKQQQQINARMPGNMQSVAWQQQQLANQTPPFSSASNAFHLQQQQRLSKMAPGGAASFGSIPGGRPMGGLNMMQNNMAAAQQRAAPNPQMSNQPQQQPQLQQQTANQSAAGLPDLAAFGQVVAGGGGRPGLQCNQGYQVTRTAAQQQQQVAFGYNVASGSFAGESELVDSLLKGHNAQEWMNDLDELLAGHH
ncbi:hypothetical protein CesoFtcFv8_009677 [Champsocephalus esox]|uniref:Neurogenic mastermind-like N-terminal domain-containing protein n=1 Tax=Champsocephalus esox TaxID=159716 RepID=A0AAN8C3B3_9TELE|nr:hypothetical protein CesoFtcFv8_009677 [Champsocephalus esox]